MGKRIGVIAILVEGRGESVRRVNDLLSQFGEIIIGRLGIPYRERGLNVISITVEGTTDEVGSLTGKLGMLPGVTTKSLLLTK
ncbi:MAG: iron-only hydrogenase system regulator [Lentisphaeria bacterium]|jgi:putative iron-only hydrogenase system regulator|nr:iron-only hydrogenase system regulator [Lentisphaeria bacterium]